MKDYVGLSAMNAIPATNKSKERMFRGTGTQLYTTITFARTVTRFAKNATQK